jgi:hypothetical protein
MWNLILNKQCRNSRKIKEDKDPEVRKNLLLKMRRLLGEADCLNEAFE